MTTQQTAHQQLLALLATTETFIPFNHEWNNGTGYFDPATEHSNIVLGKGEMAQSLSVDSENPKLHNRRILFIGVGDGTNVVIFERNEDGRNGSVVSNTPDGLANFENRTKSHTSFYPETLDLILNDQVFK